MLQEKLWNDLEKLIKMIYLQERIFIVRDLNERVGRVVEDFINIHVGYDCGVINKESITILDFFLTYKFIIANILFKKRDEYIITYKNGSNKTQIDYFFIIIRDHREYKDRKVIPSKKF